MNSQRVEALEQVVEDLRYARAYYDSWRSDGGSCFRKQFDDTAAWIEWNPELFLRKYRFYRRAIIRNTYFGLFYVIEPESQRLWRLWTCGSAHLRSGAY